MAKKLAISLLFLLQLQQLTWSAQVLAVKIDCHPIGGASKEKCESLGCVWSPVAQSSVYYDEQLGGLSKSDLPKALEDGEQKSRVDEPWCYFPDAYVGYKVLESSQYEIKLKRARPSALEADIENVLIRLTPYNSGQLLRLEVLDADKQRFVPQIPELNLGPAGGESGEFEGFKIELVNNQVQHLDGVREESNTGSQQLVIKRLSSDAVIFSTDLSKLIYSDKFIQLNSKLSSPLVFGLGEHYDNFLKLANAYKTYSFYNTDRLTLPGGTRSYGGFPFYINIDSTTLNDTSQGQRHAHGLYLRNSNAMDIVLQNDLSITFRPIGGILDFYLLIGPTPLDVISQFQHLVGLPDLPPRWSLGFHLCRYNYKSLARTREIWARTRAAGIPFDVQWNDIDYMERGNDFTYDHERYRGLPEFVNELHKVNMHYMLIFDPGVSQEANYLPYSLGEQLGIFVRNATNQTLVGKVWNQSGRTVFPDFSNPSSLKYWTELFVKFHQEVNFDGAWIDMNDISNFVDGSLDGCPIEAQAIERPPYAPGGYNLQTKSLCLSAQHVGGSEYDLHNLYAFYETIATKRALQAARPNKRTLIISRSTHPGQGHFGGHWSGDVLSNWNYLRWSIPSLLEHNMYGFTMIGSDICGFIGNTTVPLCARWSTLGAFYTFSRNHNDEVSIDQDPVALGPIVVAANKNAQTKRYSLLPYLSTLVHKATTLGQPVTRSMLFEFFEQEQDSSIKELLKAEDQFMWGPAILIAPIVEENSMSKLTYLPEGRWYELDITPESQSFEVERVKVAQVVNSRQASNKWHRTDQVALDNLVLFYRGGRIIPVYVNVRQTIPETIKQPIALEIALCPLERAHGSLTLDDGESPQPETNQLSMVVRNGLLTISLDADAFSPEVEFGQVKVYGLSIKVSSVKLTSSVNGARSLPFKQKEHMLIFDLENAKVGANKPLLVQWS